MNDDEDDAEKLTRRDHYEVGKGKPPRQHQFRKGAEWQGNRHGRPKKSLNHATIVRKVFGEKLPIVDPETGRKLTGAEAMVIRVRNDSLKGKPYAVRMADDWLQSVSNSEDQKGASELSRNHENIIEKALQRRAAREKKTGKDV